MRKLVLHEGKKDVLLSTMKSTGPKENTFGTGYDSEEATIILLHGGPGSGKTVTTKYAAEHLQRPLISISPGDLCSTSAEVDTNLDQLFKYAERWGAVLVMENADILLERRINSDINHNSVVMTFQRVLEKYSGVIFLTTSRVGALDESIETRVQVAIHYEDLTEMGRKEIWRNIIESSSARYVDKESIFQHLHWLVRQPMNGKEIQSTFKTAMKRAGDERRLDWYTLSHTLEYAGGFKNYLKRVHSGLSRDDRAKEMGNRVIGQ